MGNMYSDSKKGVANLFVGCKFNCVYCEKSFQVQMKRQKQNCIKCYNYEPHFHPERLKQSLPKTNGDEFIWLIRSGDPYFMERRHFIKVIDLIKSKPDRTFLIQTKSPAFLEEFTDILPANVMLGITYESNRAMWIQNGKKIYYNNDISKAPNPSERWNDFMELEYYRMMLTIEPILDFDMDVMIKRVKWLDPERIYIGYNSKPKQIQLPEPSLQKTTYFIDSLIQLGYNVKTKLMRESIA